MKRKNHRTHQIRAFGASGLLAFLLLGGGTPASAQAPAASAGGDGMVIGAEAQAPLVERLVTLHGEGERARLGRGVKQAARLWRAEDGTAAQFAAFVEKHFVPAKDLDALFGRFETHLESLIGGFVALSLKLRIPMDEDTGPLLPVDELFGEFSPGAHLSDDLFQTKLAFIALLNFPVTTLEERIAAGPSWTRRQWAEARLGGAFSSRVPAAVNQAVTSAYAAADNYIAEYNIYLNRVLTRQGKPLYAEEKKLISHWGLRDDLKALYVDPRGNLPRQQAIQAVMERIVLQQIPAVVVGNPAPLWDPAANTVDGKPAEREPDTRFARLLQVFQAHQLEDPYYPDEPTHILRRFNRHREIPEARFEQMLVQVLEAPVSAKVARLIEQRLGRKLQPFDIWYDGFKVRGSIPEEELDRAVKARFPDLPAFERAIPEILGQLGFDPATAAFLAERIEVDPARGSGHAWGPEMRGEKAHLRTRVPPGGMNYKGFNIAMHELGHNVEQVFSLYRVDSTLMKGVPNTAFTEAFAFVFQARDLDVLGLAKPDPRQEAMAALDDFWATREIAAVGLLDMRVWRWLYAHPQATPAEVREAVGALAREVWNRYNAPVFGVKDSPLLAIYSHMINNGLYLPDYPLGHLIAFQIEDYLRNRVLGPEMERMCRQGLLTPDLWMQGAVGSPVSAEPLLKAAEQALPLVAAKK
ncbi:MAG: hypothetical protein RBU45_11170 [Myxococcota bacterium]|jgi:hypothetical protein|nr:hypothetical protein [Myxococcota bacterium]